MIEIFLRRAAQQGGGGSSYDPDFQAVLDYADTNTITRPASGTTLCDALNQMVLDYKAQSIWSTRDVFLFWRYGDTAYEEFSKICWIRLEQVTASGNITYSANGWKPDASTPGYIATNFVPSTDGVNFAAADAQIQILLNTASTSSTDPTKNNLFGCLTDRKLAGFCANSGATRLNRDVSTSPTIDFFKTGLLSLNRDSSTALRSNTSSGEKTHTTSGTASLPSEEVYVFKRLTRTSDALGSMFTLGSSLTTAQYTAERTLLNTFFTTTGQTTIA